MSRRRPASPATTVDVWADGAAMGPSTTSVRTRPSARGFAPMAEQRGWSAVRREGAFRLRTDQPRPPLSSGALGRPPASGARSRSMRYPSEGQRGPRLDTSSNSWVTSQNMDRVRTRSRAGDNDPSRAVGAGRSTCSPSGCAADVGRHQRRRLVGAAAFRSRDVAAPAAFGQVRDRPRRSGPQRDRE
jgi:hypothetical protein